MILLATTGCAKLGYSNRVMHRVPSPDGRLVAVCQERPEFDGPGYRIRLHHADGRTLRRLYENGDGYPCDEVVWTPDGKTLGVLSRRNATLKLVDVDWALAYPSVRTSHHSWREVYLGDLTASLGSGEVMLPARLRFPDPGTIEMRPCAYSFDEARNEGVGRCSEEAVRHSMSVPRPIFDERRHRSAHAPVSDN